MKCGTYAGYKVHRKLREPLCTLCRDAMNEYRRDYHRRNPHKNAQYKAKSRNKPEKVAARQAKKDARLQAKEAAEREKLLRRLHRALKRHQATALLEGRKKISAESRYLKKEIEKTRTLLWKFNRLNKRIKRQVEAEERRIQRKQEIANRLEEKKANRQRRELLRQKLASQHGTSPGDYDRCKKTNGVACPLCKAAIAAYVRDKWKNDPKYKEREKEYLRNNPDKRYRSEDRAKRHNVTRKYYTRDHIFKRDGYNCYLCNSPVDLSASHIVGTGDWELYPHIEHVIPISKGGPDTLDNVKIAHAKCNLDKGDKILGNCVTTQPSTYT